MCVCGADWESLELICLGEGMNWIGGDHYFRVLGKWLTFFVRMRRIEYLLKRDAYSPEKWELKRNHLSYIFSYGCESMILLSLQWKASVDEHRSRTRRQYRSISTLTRRDHPTSLVLIQAQHLSLLAMAAWQIVFLQWILASLNALLGDFQGGWTLGHRHWESMFGDRTVQKSPTVRITKRSKDEHT